MIGDVKARVRQPPLLTIPAFASANSGPHAYPLPGWSIVPTPPFRQLAASPPPPAAPARTGRGRPRLWDRHRHRASGSPSR